MTILPLDKWQRRPEWLWQCLTSGKGQLSQKAIIRDTFMVASDEEPSAGTWGTRFRHNFSNTRADDQGLCWGAPMSCGHHLIRRRPLKSLGEVFKAEGTESDMGLSRHRHSEEAHVVEASAPSTRFRSSHASHTLPTCLSLPLPISNSNSNPPSTSFLILKSEVIPPCWGLTRDSAAPLIWHPGLYWSIAVTGEWR